ncbi:hypothetical protein OPU71_16570 [Niveibacterium sp. 24ML]|uniref:hypothetical protein n=1 Tax=Niveibacterium sp. 24ML TaxID=2985512 RepID=UPI00226F3E2F|nr:hypothetical protein [Niveibacterium sp. 24ML]MCX9157740.1 hypothetical protein [Niveibacterium sp. 24ML]
MGISGIERSHLEEAIRRIALSLVVLTVFDFAIRRLLAQTGVFAFTGDINAQCEWFASRAVAACFGVAYNASQMEFPLSPNHPWLGFTVSSVGVAALAMGALRILRFERDIQCRLGLVLFAAGVQTMLAASISNLGEKLLFGAVTDYFGVAWSSSLDATGVNVVQGKLANLSDIVLNVGGLIVSLGSLIVTARMLLQRTTSPEILWQRIAGGSSSIDR